MRIAFCTPFKPLNHPRPSGDVMIAQSLYDFLEKQGHELLTPPHFETTWFFWRPRRWPELVQAMLKARRFIREQRPDLWFTYHSYDKAPDVLGSMAASAGVPYCVYSGSYAPNRGKKLRYRPGFLVNRHALRAAYHVFAKEWWDFEDVRQLLPEDRVSYVPPGLFPEHFERDEQARQRLRQEWGVGGKPVVLSVAMFRKGVKVQGLTYVIQACGKLLRQGLDLELVIAGDGPERDYVHALGHKECPGKVRFLGLTPRNELPPVYSAADLFAFPGINEAVGMVYIEAQSCGVPVVAFDHAGGKVNVAHERCGLVTPSFDLDAFTDAIGLLASSREKRQAMGREAALYVREHHDLSKNYAAMENVLYNAVNNGKRA